METILARPLFRYFVCPPRLAITTGMDTLRTEVMIELCHPRSLHGTAFRGGGETFRRLGRRKLMVTVLPCTRKEGAG